MLARMTRSDIASEKYLCQPGKVLDIPYTNLHPGSQSERIPSPTYQMLCPVQSAASQNGASAAQVDNNGKAAHAAVVQAVVAVSNGRSVRHNGAAALGNGAAVAHQDGSTTVEELKNATTIVSVTENGAVGADSEQNGAWADPCEVGHSEACAADRYASNAVSGTKVAMPVAGFGGTTHCMHAAGMLISIAWRSHLEVAVPVLTCLLSSFLWKHVTGETVIPCAPSVGMHCECPVPMMQPTSA